MPTWSPQRSNTPATSPRQQHGATADLVDRVGFACALGEGLPPQPIPGLRGASLAANDPLLSEWDVVILSPHFSAALLARDPGHPGADVDRLFEYTLTYRQETVIAAAHCLLTRVARQPPRHPPASSLDILREQVSAADTS